MMRFLLTLLIRLVIAAGLRPDRIPSAFPRCVPIAFDPPLPLRLRAPSTPADPDEPRLALAAPASFAVLSSFGVVSQHAAARRDL